VAGKVRALLFVVVSLPADRFQSAEISSSRGAAPLILKSVLIALVGHLNPRRNGTEVWPSVARLVELTGLGDSTIRRAIRQLEALHLIKIRSDSGRTSLYTINDPVIRGLANPCPGDRGAEANPVPGDRGTPFPGTGHPVPGDRRNSKRTAKGNNKGISSISCSSPERLVDGPHQRKLAVLGLVAEAADRMRSPDREQQTGKKSAQDREEALRAAGAGGTRE